MVNNRIVNGGSRECDHTRGLGAQRRSSAITVCHCCRDFLCSICGVTIDWFEGLCVTNPPAQWRYCAKDACVEAEAAYHALPVDEMIRHRGTGKKMTKPPRRGRRQPPTQSQARG